MVFTLGNGRLAGRLSKGQEVTLTRLRRSWWSLSYSRTLKYPSFSRWLELSVLTNLPYKRTIASTSRISKPRSMSSYQTLPTVRLSPADIRYVMVDEYQDTNYVQEQLLLRISEHNRNLCVVERRGPEPIPFPRRHSSQHPRVSEAPGGLYRHQADHELSFPQGHHAAVSTDGWPRQIGRTQQEFLSATTRLLALIQKPITLITQPCWPFGGATDGMRLVRFADLVEYLKQNNVISDYRQIALLLHSVRQEHSGPYIQALEDRGIPAFCPRARAFFDNDEVRDMVACLAIIFGWHGNGRGSVSGATAQSSRLRGPRNSIPRANASHKAIRCLRHCVAGRPK